MTSGSAESFDERDRLCSVRRSPSVTASPSEVLVSTSPSKSGLIASGPVGTSATTSRSIAVAASVQASPASAAVSTVTVAPGSVFA